MRGPTGRASVVAENLVPVPLKALPASSFRQVAGQEVAGGCDAPGRLLVITTPSGLERFFEQFAELLPGPVDPEEFAAVGRANWIEFVGPPVAVSDPL